MLLTSSCAPGTMHRLVPKTAPSRCAFTPSRAVAYVFSERKQEIEWHWSRVHHHDSKSAIEAFSEHLRDRQLFRSVKVVEATAVDDLLGSEVNRQDQSESRYVIALTDFTITTEMPFWSSFFRMMVFLPRKYSIGAQMIVSVGQPHKAMRTIKVTGKHEIASRQVFPEKVLKKALLATVMDIFDQAINQIAKELSVGARGAGPFRRRSSTASPTSSSPCPSAPARRYRPRERRLLFARLVGAAR
jgi:hypothetical protein